MGNRVRVFCVENAVSARAIVGPPGHIGPRLVRGRPSPLLTHHSVEASPFRVRARSSHHFYGEDGDGPGRMN